MLSVPDYVGLAMDHLAYLRLLLGREHRDAAAIEAHLLEAQTGAILAMRLLDPVFAANQDAEAQMMDETVESNRQEARRREWIAAGLEALRVREARGHEWIDGPELPLTLAELEALRAREAADCHSTE